MIDTLNILDLLHRLALCFELPFYKKCWCCIAKTKFSKYNGKVLICLWFLYYPSEPIDFSIYSSLQGIEGSVITTSTSETQRGGVVQVVLVDQKSLNLLKRKQRLIGSESHLKDIWVIQLYNKPEQ